MPADSDPDAFAHHRVPNTPANQFRGHALISDQVSVNDIALVWRELEHVLAAGVPGAVVEFGCYAGTASLFIRRLLNESAASPGGPVSPSAPSSSSASPAGEAGAAPRAATPGREFHVYDSFEGLPPKVQADQSAAGTDFQAGKLAVSKKEFLRQFQTAGLKPPVVHKGWFSDLTAHDLPPQIAFAFLDGDFYDSILDSLKLVWPRLAPGATVLIDDYQRPELPGVERAVRDFFRQQGGPVPPLRIAHNIAVLHT